MQQWAGHIIWMRGTRNRTGVWRCNVLESDHLGGNY